jgi:hypothetical protein
MFLIVNGALLLAVVSGPPCSALQHSTAQHSTAKWLGVTLLLLVLHQLGLHAAFEVSAGCLGASAGCQAWQIPSTWQALLPAALTLPCCRWRHPCWTSACLKNRPQWLARWGWACDARPLLHLAARLPAWQRQNTCGGAPPLTYLPTNQPNPTRPHSQCTINPQARDGATSSPRFMHFPKTCRPATAHDPHLGTPG